MRYLTALGIKERLKKQEESSRRCVENYVLIWLAISLIIFFFLAWFWYPYWNAICKTVLTTIFLVLLSVRLFDIVISAICLSFLREKGPGSAGKSLILSLINYLEIILIFSVTNFISQCHYGNPFGSSIFNSFRYSFGVFVPIIPIPTDLSIAPSTITRLGHILFYVQVCISFVIHVTLVQRVLSYFPVVKEANQSD